MSRRNSRDGKAARRAERARRDANSTVPVRRAGRPGPRADTVVNRFFASFTSDDPPRSCPHVNLARPLDDQEHAWWAAWEPGAVRCGDCRQQAGPAPDACSYCGRNDPDTSVTAAEAGGMTMLIALCPPCRTADQAGTTTPERLTP